MLYCLQQARKGVFLFMWNARRSLMLSKLCVVGFALALLGVLVGSPWVVGWLLSYMRAPLPYYAVCFYLTFFTGGPLCLYMLYSLFRLLQNMGEAQVFVQQNTVYMRRISWACLVGGCLAALSAIYWTPWLAVAVAALFAGLVVRVFKNVLAQAIRLKEENDYTI